MSKLNEIEKCAGDSAITMKRLTFEFLKIGKHCLSMNKKLSEQVWFYLQYLRERESICMNSYRFLLNSFLVEKTIFMPKKTDVEHV